MLPYLTSISSFNYLYLVSLAFFHFIKGMSWCCGRAVMFSLNAVRDLLILPAFNSVSLYIYSSKNNSTTQSNLLALLALYLCLLHLTLVRRADLTVTDSSLQLQVVLMFFYVLFFCDLLEEVFLYSKEPLSLGRSRSGHTAKELWFHTEEGRGLHAVTTTVEYAWKTVWGSSPRHVFDFRTQFLGSFE